MDNLPFGSNGKLVHLLRLMNLHRPLVYSKRELRIISNRTIPMTHLFDFCAQETSISRNQLKCLLIPW